MTRLLGWLACAGAVVLLVAAMVMAADPAEAAASPVTAPSITGPRVTVASVRLAAVPGRPAAGYFTLTAGSAATELGGVTSPMARIELHAMRMAGAVMRMDTLHSVRVAAGQTVRFAPGGNHLMLFDVAAGVRPGGTIPLTFVFADGTRQTVAAAVRAASDATMPGMAM